MQDCVRLRPQSLRPDRPLRAGVRAGDRSRARSCSAARRSRGSGWLPFMVICFCLAISACYELIEWWTALVDRRRRRPIPRHAGRRVGHAVGHADGADRRDRLAPGALEGAGRAVGEDGHRGPECKCCHRPGLGSTVIRPTRRERPGGHRKGDSSCSGSRSFSSCCGSWDGSSFTSRVASSTFFWSSRSSFS